MKVPVYEADGNTEGEIDLPPVFDTPYRYDIIHKVYTCLRSHLFQPKGTHPTAGQDVSADSYDPPTGHGQARMARIRGGGGRRQGEAAEVASTRGGRQAHPPKARKSIYKKVNRKERRLALCSAIAATASRDTIEARGHATDGIPHLPVVVSNEVEKITSTKDMLLLMNALKLSGDMSRLERRRARSGKPALRGRSKKTGKSVLFVASSSAKLAKACGSLPGVDAVDARNLSVLDLAPGSAPARLTVYTKDAVNEIASVNSPHIELAVTLK